MIHIVCGVYGHYIDGKVVAKDKDSAPFSLPPEREAELVAQGVAEYVEAPAEAHTEGHSEAHAPIGFDDMPELPEGVIPIPEYSVESKADELRRIGKLCGLTFKVGTSKADMVAALDKFIDEHTVDDLPEGHEVEDDEGEDDEDLDLPDFDPAEAVE